MSPRMSNIPLRDVRFFLKAVGCIKKRTSGGHEIWHKEGITRPIVLQTHKDPVPLHVVQNNLRTLGMTLDDFTKVVYGV